MKKAFIWDLDGTLLDSYSVIVDSTYEVLAQHGIQLDKEFIYKKAIETSVSDVLELYVKQAGASLEELLALYGKISAEKKMDISLMPHAKEVLFYFKEKGYGLFVYTHRGPTTEPVLKKLGIYDCFTEIVTSENNFPRKPAPDGLLYLVEKYGLDPKNTYYVGDRKLDIYCAKNAGVKAILFCRENSYSETTGLEDIVVQDLNEI